VLLENVTNVSGNEYHPVIQAAYKKRISNMYYDFFGTNVSEYDIQRLMYSEEVGELTEKLDKEVIALLLRATRLSTPQCIYIRPCRKTQVAKEVIRVAALRAHYESFSRTNGKVIANMSLARIEFRLWMRI